MKIVICESHDKFDKRRKTLPEIGKKYRVTTHVRKANGKKLYELEGLKGEWAEENFKIHFVGFTPNHWTPAGPIETFQMKIEIEWDIPEDFKEKMKKETENWTNS